MIDSMSDADFLDFLDCINSFVDTFIEDYDEEIWAGDEGCEDKAAKFYGNNPDDIEDDNSLPL